MWFLFSCLKSTVHPEPTKEFYNAAEQQLLVAEDLSLDEAHKRPWPPRKWDRAEAYVFNGELGANGKTDAHIWNETWSDSIQKAIPLTPAQAELSLELIHRGGGTFVLTKCPIVPRHGVVFFAGDEPVASWSLCFECGDALTWPTYHASREEEAERYRWTKEEDGEIVFLYDQLHSLLMAKWKRYFNLVGALEESSSGQ